MPAVLADRHPLHRSMRGHGTRDGLELRQRLTDARASVQDLKDRLDALAAEISDMNSRTTGAEQHLSSRQLDQRDAHLRSLRAQHVALQSQLSAAQKNLRDLGGRPV